MPDSSSAVAAFDSAPTTPDSDSGGGFTPSYTPPQTEQFTPPAQPREATPSGPTADSILGEMHRQQAEQRPQGAEPVAEGEPNPESPEGQPATPTLDDLADFPEFHPHRDIFTKQMSRDARKLVLENFKSIRERANKIPDYEKQLQEAIDSRYYFDEDAITTHPDHKKIVNTISTVDQLYLPHWHQQKAALEAGEPVYDLVEDKNGRLVPGNEIPKDPTLRAQLDSQITRLEIYRDKLTRQRGDLEGRYVNEAKNFQGALKKIESSMTQTATPELRSAVEKNLQQFPAYCRNRVEFKLIATALAIHQPLLAKIKALESQIAGRVQGQQSPEEIQQGGNGRINTGPTLQQMKSRMSLD